jgi:uncharacterized peroxidase-related enzyme
MPVIDPIKMDTANEGQKKILEGIQAKMGTIPNIYATMAHSPSTLQAMLAYGMGLKKGVLTPKEIEAIALAVGANNTCDYCVAAHTVIGMKSGLTEAETIEARQGISSDPKMDALLELAVEVSQKRGRPLRKVVDAFKAAGYSDAALIEVIAWVAYNLFTNYFNHVVETEVDFPKPPEIV